MSRNDITGDKLVSKTGNTEAYASNYDRIFGKRVKVNEDSLYSASEDTPELHTCDTAEHRKCNCPNWTLGCCGAGTKYGEEG